MAYYSTGTLTIGHSVTESRPSTSWGRSSNTESPPSSTGEFLPRTPTTPHTPATTVTAYEARSGGSERVPTLEGWPLLAELMADKPAYEAFARFRNLNVKNLLYYQVQLAKLDRNLRDRELDDMKPRNDDPDPLSEYKGSELHQKPEKMIETDSPQWEYVTEMRTLLREYNEALLQYAQVSALAEPTGHNMRELVSWMWADNLGQQNVRGLAADGWGPLNARDRTISISRIFSVLWHFFRRPPKSSHAERLVAPRAPNKAQDRLNRWISEEVIPVFFDLEAWYRNGMKNIEKNKQGHDEEKNHEKQRAEENTKSDPRITEQVHSCLAVTITRITGAICTIVACMLPIAAIFLLTLVKDLYHRLSMISVFALVFATLLMLLSEANRVQVFTATSAFLAVLVVFIPAGGG